MLACHLQLSMSLPVSVSITTQSESSSDFMDDHQLYCSAVDRGGSATISDSTLDSMTDPWLPSLSDSDELDVDITL